MTLKPVGGGLRPIWNDSKQPAKVLVHVAPGDALHVSDDVAAQLKAGAASFKDGEPTWTPDDLVGVEGDATGDAGAPVEPVEPVVDEQKPAAKRGRKAAD